MKISTSTVKWIFMAVLALIWGSSFILMKRGLEEFTPPQVASIRMVAAFLCLLPFIIRHTGKIEPGQWKFIFATGLLGNGIPAFLFTIAQTAVPSFMAGMLNSLTPLFTLIIGYFIFHSEVSFSKVVGVALGLGGAVGLILMNSGGTQANVSWYPLLIVLATVLYGCSVNIIRHKLHNVESVLISGFALCIVGPPCAIYLFTTDFTDRLSNHPAAYASFGYALLLGIFGTAISIVLFNKLIKISGALFASSVTYLIPIVAMLWGITDNELLSLWHLFALGAILSGVYLINLKKKPLVTV
jgi:drug/metabolite transporter (DMT)-like permease